MKWDAKQVLKQCEVRRVYMGLYRRKSAEAQGHDWLQALDEHEREALQTIEDDQVVAVTKTWRRLALSQLNEEAKARAASLPKQSSGWFSRKKPAFKDLSEEQRKFLQDFNVGESEQQVFPPDWIKLRIELKLKLSMIAY